MKSRFTILVLVVIFLAGCTQLGPNSVTRDRFDYNTAISNSWKEQTLLNIVKLRYLDMPLFVDISSILSGYTMQSQVNLNGQVITDGDLRLDVGSLGASGTYTDRPTITYVPITGEKFNKSIMTPIPPSVILFLAQSGRPIDLIYPITVDSINGLRGQISGGVNARPGDPKFNQLINLFRKIQQSSVVGMRVIRGEEQQETTIMYFYRENIPAEIQDALQEVRSLLGLKPGVQEVRVEYGLIPEDDTEITMITRSMIQIIVDMANQVTVPEEHITAGWTRPRKFGSADDDYSIRIKFSGPGNCRCGDKQCCRC